MEIKKPKIAKLLKDIISQFNVFDLSLIDYIYIKMFHAFEEMDNGIFVVNNEVEEPQIIKGQIKVKSMGFIKSIWEKIRTK